MAHEIIYSSCLDAGRERGYPGLACWPNLPAGAVAAPPDPIALSTNSIGPRIAFSTETYNAGTNIVGDPIRYTFLVTNTGDETLVISNVHAGCSCTVVNETASNGSNFTWTHEGIPPGQTGIIPISIATNSGIRGPFSKYVTVASNDRTRPSVNLFIAGVAREPVEAPLDGPFHTHPRCYQPEQPCV